MANIFDKLTEVTEEFKCPISFVIMDDPAMTDDGYTYERSVI